jgi:hypothetical protein
MTIEEEALYAFLESKGFKVDVTEDQKQGSLFAFFKSPSLYTYNTKTKLLRYTELYIDQNQKPQIKSIDFHVSIDKLKSMLKANEKES